MPDETPRLRVITSDPAETPMAENVRAFRDSVRAVGVQDGEPIGAVTRALASIVTELEERDRRQAERDAAQERALAFVLAEARENVTKAMEASAEGAVSRTVMPAVERALWRRSVAFDRLTAATVAGALVLGMGLAGAAGWMVRDRQLTAVSTSLQAAAFLYGNSQAATWQRLMEANDPDAALAHATRGRDEQGPWASMALRLGPAAR